MNTGYIVLIAYIIGALLSFPKFFYVWLENFSLGQPEAGDIVLSFLFTLPVVLFYPIIWVSLLIHKFVFPPLVSHVTDRLNKRYERIANGSAYNKPLSYLNRVFKAKSGGLKNEM